MATDQDPIAGLRGELSQLRERVTGVRGSILGGVDGLFLLQDGATGQDPHDLAALAAASFGVGRQVGHILRQGPHLETTIHCGSGYFVIYSIDDSTLLALLADAGVNIARLHLEFRAGNARIAEAVRAATGYLVAQRPRL